MRLKVGALHSFLRCFFFYYNWDRVIGIFYGGFVFGFWCICYKIPFAGVWCWKWGHRTPLSLGLLSDQSRRPPSSLSPLPSQTPALLPLLNIQYFSDFSCMYFSRLTGCISHRLPRRCWYYCKGNAEVPSHFANSRPPPTSLSPLPHAQPRPPLIPLHRKWHHT